MFSVLIGVVSAYSFLPIPHVSAFLFLCDLFAAFFTLLHPTRLLRYVYELEASTGGGTGVSDKYVIQTPVSCPTGITSPYNVTVSSPYAISVAWAPPGE